MNRLLVVEVNSAIAFQPGLIQPAERRRINQHEEAIQARIQPYGRPLPEKESAYQQLSDWQEKEQDRPPSPLADSKGHAAQKDDRRQGKDDRRDEIVREDERSANLEGLLVRHEVAEDD